jgi:phosphatidylcholine synthase
MPWNLICAWLVHLYTGLGVVVGFLSLLRIEQRDFRSVFFLMAVAIVLDATDGTLARAARVKELIPWFDGDTLDGIVD